ncbi:MULTISPECIES: preprotein translocase subunit YajC [Citrifermentans]|jgi:preprotein translocase subunit YajC|uniref:Sec translocon accessory complex subunit YajC n=1 Tax=Citrifermentans bemidjiense (strain ATCC BAA-1014 / DSM 16622 / JCM 12645 / Bem) TaxID=404380 RepID=B5EFX7_CITBB|nr:MULTISPECIES: preprotein translocase subunit YajC [Citrifermentans]ACH39442.1 preprotein translocase, YajC subunit [Citrifermentans bemidjiense Bem]
MFGVAVANAAQDAGAQAGGMMAQFQGLIPLVFMFAIFYFLLIRPQQKKAKEHRALLDALKKGDQVVTAGGMHGKVTALDDQVVTLEIAPGVNVRINKGYIASIKQD